jgi:hypothetical protein
MDRRALRERFELARAMAREEIAARTALERRTQRTAAAVDGDPLPASATGDAAAVAATERWAEPPVESEVARTVAWCWRDDAAVGADLNPLRRSVAEALVATSDALFRRLVEDVVAEVERAVTGGASVLG